MASKFQTPLKSILQRTGKQKPQGVIGYLDQIGHNFVRGWAADQRRPGKMLRVRVYLDDLMAAEGEASVFREDLKTAGYGEGLHGYQFPVPTKALFCAEWATIVAVEPDEQETIIVRRLLRPASARTEPVLYFDASDLIEFLTHHRELSGIQRVQAGYILNLGNATIGNTSCQVCTRLKFTNFYWDVPHSRLAQLLAESGNLGAVPARDWADHIHRFKLSLMTERAAIQAGDTVFTLGAPWALDQHNEVVRCLKYFYRARYDQIFYDLIPISSPEVVPAPLIPHFARAMAAMSNYADHIFSISHHAKTDLAATLQRLGRPVPPISVIPMGGSVNDVGQPTQDHAGVLQKLGITKPFVLSVGTLEPRKNHVLLFQVWRRLVAKYGAAKVPKLVLVGRVGWYMDDFMRMLKITNYVDGTIIHLTGVSNAELGELYGSCMFTMFPSFTEGWGLPITESLAYGKVCVCSNVTSMPEAGGDHVVYIDPFDSSAVFEICDRLINDPDDLAAKEAHLRATFKPQSWTEASASFRQQLAALSEQPAPPATARPPIVLGRTYKFFNIEASEPDASSQRVFGNFLDQEDALDLLVGWNWFDLDVNCTWACGQAAELSIVPPQEAPAELVAYVEVLASPTYADCRCAVTVDGRAVGSFVATTQAKRLVVEMSRVESGRPVSLRFDLVEARVPTGADLRLIGLGIRSALVFDKTDLVGRIRMLEMVGTTILDPGDAQGATFASRS